ncbi:aliphatic sulfonates transmembrane abc transporterprotein [Mycobacteroides abscessus subsp. bolletii 2B-1231]|uniref:ABC transporter permease n=6 Tax=Mycobacteroides abscessus TaxID=36809 RepID=A0A829HWH1_9MYCO|nr:aliphatic sulfonates transport permease protein ssuC [Mycobacteroides abscessus subsp. bolletii 50594]EIU61769.1 aliphatic sulfonates transmembrane abc transporterprotein [Mycobacteroides abscessus subsp. bolletii 1S-151-0930]EIU76724.1 aliphatic sulfonates transmembrane abc transporterprotein [Mycobacteroides abscessus subsp. bolletii 1S-153-0915]EIV12862.1 aliphatic sulfonates transmembrane abc transporterprotein [Mycobacteroides abscessus subsp. bolletii 2B-0307]EIV13112.1 aliphatic sulfo
MRILELFMTTRNTLVAAAATDSDAPVSSPSRREWVFERRWEIVRFLSPLAVLLIWQAGSAWGLIDPDILPAPSTIARAGFELIANGQLAEALRVSGVRAAEGLLLGGVVGVALGAAVGLSRLADAVVDPTMQMIRALPHLGLIPLFIVWFGIGELPKVLMVALGAAFPLYLNTTSAIRQVDPKLFETAQVLGFSFWQRLRVIVIPGATPQVLVGLRQSLALSWLTLIVAEQINADAGVGFLINNARDFLRIDVIIFGLVVYALLGIVTDAIVRVLERRALRYRS